MSYDGSNEAIYSLIGIYLNKLNKMKKKDENKDKKKKKRN